VSATAKPPAVRASPPRAAAGTEGAVRPCMPSVPSPASTRRPSSWGRRDIRPVRPRSAAGSIRRVPRGPTRSSAGCIHAGLGRSGQARRLRSSGTHAPLQRPAAPTGNCMIEVWWEKAPLAVTAARSCAVGAGRARRYERRGRWSPAVQLRRRGRLVRAKPSAGFAQRLRATSPSVPCHSGRAVQMPRRSDAGGLDAPRGVERRSATVHDPAARRLRATRPCPGHAPPAH
jgi:hypothetical protein